MSRKIVEKGADLVVCQHSHCIGCYEKYEDATIVYGQGNFIFDYLDSEYWQTSLLLKIEITDKLNVKYIPFVKEANVIRKADEKQEKEIFEELKKRSEAILQEGFVDNQYTKFADNNIESI